MRIRCLVEGCLGEASNSTNLRVHFAHRHVQDTIVIMEEGNQPYPRCPMCDIFVSHKALNGRHLTTAFFWQGEERKRRCLVEEESRVGAEVVITAYGVPLSPVTSFKYLGRFLSAADNDWRRENSTKILEGSDRGEGDPIGCDHHLCPCQ